MPRTLLAASLALLLAPACAEPSCPSGERRFGTECAPLRQNIDAAAPHATDEAGVIAEEADASAPGVPTSGPDGGAASTGAERDAAGAPPAACAEGDAQVACHGLDQACIGSAGKAICEGATLIVCSGDGIALRKDPCASDKHCQQGLAGGACAQCVTNEHHCTGSRLEVCAADGQAWQVLEECPVDAPCNASAAACTSAACLPGGKRCSEDTLEVCNADQTGYVEHGRCGAGLCDEVDGECKVCVAGAKRCDGDVALACAPDGLRETRTVCPGRCAGSGQCVECVGPEDCPAPEGECRVPTCSAAGACVQANAPSGAACSTGTCSAGTCTCQSTDDCAAGDLCRSGACVANRCGDGVQGGTEQCDDGNRSNADACLNDCTNARCGDGFVRTEDPVSSRNEACDASANGWNSTTCFKCEVAIYTPCTSDAQCPTTKCATNLGFCTTPTNQCAVDSTAPAGCETIPGWSSLCILGVCGVACDAGRCPNGLTCNGANWCQRM